MRPQEVTARLGFSKKEQVQEGENSPGAAPGENMEFREQNGRSLGAIPPPRVSIACR